MNQPELTPMPADAAALLATASDIPGPSAVQSDRVYTRIGATVGFAAVAGSSTSAAAASSGIAGKKLLLVMAVVGTVGGIGYAVRQATRASATITDSSTPRVVVTRPAAVPAPPPAAPPTAVVVVAEPEPAVVTPTVAPRPTPRVRAKPAPRTPKVSERQLLDRARAAISAGRSNQAIAALADHLRLFRRGRLAEERDAMWILSLARARQHVAAAKRALVFRRRYRGSIYAPAIKSALSAKPVME